jgi:predicted dinucleotide-binding enzyme
MCLVHECSAIFASANANDKQVIAAFLGSTGCQPVLFGSLPKSSSKRAINAL